MSYWGDMSLYKRAKSIHEEMKKEKDRYKPQMEEVVKYTRPDLPLETDKNGSFVGADIYGGSSAHAPLIQANGFTGYLAGPNIAWRQDVIGDWRLMGDDPLNLWLQYRGRAMRDEYNRSNFYSVLPHIYLDGFTQGTPFVFPEADEHGEIFYTLPHFTENFWERDERGRVIRYHRDYEIRAAEAAEKFGIENLSKRLETSLENGRHSEKHKFLRCLYRRTDGIFDNLDGQDKFVLPPTGEWVEFYIEQNTDATKELPLATNMIRVSDGNGGRRTIKRILGRFGRRPFCYYDYKLNVRSLVAVTPGWMAIHDTRASQQAWKNWFQNLQLATEPPTVALAETRGRVHLRPRGQFWAQSLQEYDHPPKFIDLGRRPDMQMEFLDKIDKNMERHYHKQLWTMLYDRAMQHKQPVTAFEIANLMGEGTVLLSSGIHGAEVFLADIDECTAATAEMGGRLPSPEDFGIDKWEIAEQTGVDVEEAVRPSFQGLLSKAQKSRAEMEPLLGGLAVFGQLLEMFPMLGMMIKQYELGEHVLEINNFPQELMRTKDEFEQAYKEAAQREATAEMMGSAVDAATVAEKMGKDIGPNSPIAMLTGGTNAA